MKKQFMGMALFGLCVAPAFAESSTTFFGAVDVGIRHIQYSGSGSATSVGTFGNSPSLFGVRGTEDLGGSMNAIFLLESAFTPDTGQSATGAFGVPFFNRSAWVGLNGNFGEVHLGRDWSPNYVNMYSFDPTYNLGVGNVSHYSNLLNQGLVPNYYWTTNAITYSTPGGLGGMYGSFQVSAGEAEMVATATRCAAPRSAAPSAAGWGMREVRSRSQARSRKPISRRIPALLRQQESGPRRMQA
jgi:predicted porin